MDKQQFLSYFYLGKVVHFTIHDTTIDTNGYDTHQKQRQDQTFIGTITYFSYGGSYHRERRYWGIEIEINNEMYFQLTLDKDTKQINYFDPCEYECDVTILPN